jgi:hypothetical protein
MNPVNVIFLLLFFFVVIPTPLSMVITLKLCRMHIGCS